MDRGPTSHAFISQRLRLHYVEWGDPAAPPLVLLHGGRDHCRSWDWTARALAKDWRIVAPDLRGHGDSAWSPDGDYSMGSFIYDFAQLMHQLRLAPATIVAHSLGGNIALRYSGLYPENVKRLVAIEGLGPSPKMIAQREAAPFQQRWRKWIEEKRQAAGRAPKRYPTIESALERMKEENGYLSDEQARHLTAHGVSQNEDGTYSWKFDNYMRVWAPVDITHEEIAQLWAAIACPTLLLYGDKSWASNPVEDGRAKHFRDARVELFENAGHWLHHDRFDHFMEQLHAFL
ncbi:MAG: alpha/beta hydrolase [Hyphomonadaceae bacterium]|nr:MAG: alpha/beta hydrolase [Caulobacteraceae bacterium]MBT9446401.1 alpha/beta hydrolase [Hyphomonadaceae bacterium]TPW04928.1 MAG: alpha/beta hydrolase [Alphaproteobacteria bacterium]